MNVREGRWGVVGQLGEVDSIGTQTQKSWANALVKRVACEQGTCSHSFTPLVNRSLTPLSSSSPVGRCCPQYFSSLRLPLQNEDWKRKCNMPVMSLSSPFLKNIGRLVSYQLLISRPNPRLKCFFRQMHMESHHSFDPASRGALIVLEGLDRCGKTSQSRRLHSFLEGLGNPVELWRFPDRSTSVGQMISAYLSNKSHLDDHAIHLLFSANRWEKRSLMEAKLRSGTTLVVDRYSYSGVAFSSAKGLDVEWCKAPDMGLLAPDLVVYLDILPEKAAERGGYGDERYEQLEFQKKVAESYRTLFDPSWKIVDATLSIEDIEKQLRDIVLDCVTKCGKGKHLPLLWHSY